MNTIHLRSKKVDIYQGNGFETFSYRDYTVKIVEDPDNDPRKNFDNLGSLSLFYKKMNLANEEKLLLKKCQDIEKNTVDYICLPVYMYDHSAFMLQTFPWNDKFDSGKVGIIYAKREKVIREFGFNYLPEQIDLILKSELKTYSDYLNGYVYGYQISKNNEILDSCYGFYGCDHVDSDLVNSAICQINFLADQELEETKFYNSLV
ncbi:MAG: hypothetical protein UV26_C0030G0007 [candidate division WWE3 bacterium GW2011_GWF2_42_42]|uniref:Uncharacterized protein n=1 Tax=candidate division WWE3 bacterium GW2011_GWF2_42_42 TaxID=1619142 RepID=A0A0G1ADA4_UNCKA|nr:MAG: hypothetical protein UV26_C0030G0007 [candidate division WWE3 bacterium GW2011_GWF2_42_42]